MAPQPRTITESTTATPVKRRRRRRRMTRVGAATGLGTTTQTTSAPMNGFDYGVLTGEIRGSIRQFAHASGFTEQQVVAAVKKSLNW